MGCGYSIMFSSFAILSSCCLNFWTIIMLSLFTMRIHNKTINAVIERLINMFYIITKMVTTQNKTSRKIIDKLRLKNEKMLSKEEIIKTIGDYQKIYKRKVNLISLWTYLRKNKSQMVFGIGKCFKRK